MKTSVKTKRVAFSVFSIGVLVVISLITCYPFLMMISGSFKQNYELFSNNLSLIPQRGFNLEMYHQLFANWPFFKNMFNSVVVSFSSTVLTCVFCTMAGFTFAKYEFPFKNGLFTVMLASMMIPSVANIVPSYLIVRSLGGLNRLWSLIIPGCVPAFGVFMMRQFAYQGVPIDAIEYARVEGASETRILTRLAFPMLAPGIFSLAILTFMNSWNDFLWPIIMMTKKEMLTVTALLRSIGDVSLNGSFGVLLAATTLSTVPILVFYLIFHKQLIQGILEGMGKE
jgi:ABC-type sugar transport system, permease component